MSTTPVPENPSTLRLKQAKLYGRRYQVQVLLPADASGNQTVLTVADSSFNDPDYEKNGSSSLRVRFSVAMHFLQFAWYADVEIYNLDSATRSQLIQGAGSQGSDSTSQVPIKQGMKVVVSAGYQNGNYGVIWEGDVFQALFDRENVVDYKITLHCILGLNEAYRPTISSVYAGQLNQTQIIDRLSKAANIPIAGISPNIKPNKLPRAKVIFGSPARYFTQIAEDNNMQWFLSKKGLTLARIDDNIATDSSALVFTPETGLIGTPQQTQYGVSFRVLMDPRVEIRYPAMLVNIDNSSIVLLKRSIGDLPTVLDQNGTYIVLGVRHIGDTRGNEWYTEITGLTSINGKWAAAQALAARANLNRSN